MARRSLKPQLNQIRTWVGQGRTDAWIAHQLEVSVRDLVAFKREHELAPPDTENGDQDHPFGATEDDLRAQDDALVAAALDAEPEEEPAAAEEAGDDPEGDDQTPRRRRGRRGGAAAAGAGVNVRSREPSTTARRATASGSTPRSRTTRPTPSTGPVTVRS